MTVKKYKTGNIIIKVNSPVEIEDKRPYSDFLYYGNEQESFTVNLEFIPCIPEINGKIIYESDEEVCTDSVDGLKCFYRGGKDGEFYAVRIPYEKGCKIQFPEKYKDRLWARVIFTVMGIEEISALYDAVVFHSSFICKDGYAILFTGKCGMGKSTQAGLWEKYAKAEIINGDKSLLYIKDSVPYASGLPYSGSSPICKNEEYPIKAIINLGQAPYNKADRLNMLNAFSAVYKSTYPASNIKELKNRQINVIEKIVSSVPVYYFPCLPDESAVRYLEGILC